MFWIPLSNVDVSNIDFYFKTNFSFLFKMYWQEIMYQRLSIDGLKLIE